MSTRNPAARIMGVLPREAYAVNSSFHEPEAAADNGEFSLIIWKEGAETFDLSVQDRGQRRISQKPRTTPAPSFWKTVYRAIASVGYQPP